MWRRLKWALFQRIRRRKQQRRLLLLMRLRMLDRERNYLTTNALIDPSESPWFTLYHSRDRRSIIKFISIDPDSFDLLLSKFDKHYIVRSGPGKRGRPCRIMDKHTVLGCLLHFYTAEVRSKTLCKLFGVPPATLSRVLGFAEIALSHALKELHDARIMWPSFAEQRAWASLCQSKEPLIKVPLWL